MIRPKTKPAMTAKSSRLPTNIVSFTLTCLILSVAIGLSSATEGFSNSLDKIKKNMEVVLDDMKNALPNYTDFIETQKYLSGNITFKPKGMAGLYNLTTQLINILLPQDVLMKDLLVWKDFQSYPELNDGVTIGDILKYYWPLVLVVAILVLITVVVPIVGLFFCCCRCCGNCGARSKPCDKRTDLCKKVLLGALLIVLGTALLFCVVCAFASNQHIQEGTNDLPDNLRHSYKDSIAYLDVTKDQTINLLNKNYKEFSSVFKETVQKSGVHVMQQLNIWSNATAMMDLYNLVEALPNITQKLGQLKVYTNNLRTMASQLNDAMRKVKRDLLTLLNNCSLDSCASIQKQISNLQTNIDFNRLPDVTPAIDLLAKLNLNVLKTAAEEGKRKLDNIERHITKSLNDTLKQAMYKVEQAGATVQDNLKKILQTISDIQIEINSIDGTLEDGYRYLNQYSPYRYYGGLAISCSLLLITICIAFGLICGICGKRPDGYSDNCCNKGAGSQFLICGVMLMFIFTLVIGVVTIGTLLLGLTSDRGVCHPLRHPEQSNVINFVDNLIAKQSIRNVPGQVRIGAVLSLCYKNQSMYSVFNLSNTFDVDDIRKQFNVESILDSIQHHLDRIVDPHFTILNHTNLSVLRNLSSFDPGINFDHFQDELKENFTNMSLKKLSEVLQKLSQQMDGHFEMAIPQRGLNLTILHVNAYDENILGPMRIEAKKAMDIAQHLDSSLKMNSTSFKEAIEKLINEIEDAQTKLREDGSKMLINAATSFGSIVKHQVHSYIERVIYVTKFKVGQCGPLNVAINSTLISTCDKILLPWNGFWVSLYASLLLFLPTIIVSVKLSSLYQKHKQYGQYVETGGKRGKNKKKKGKNHEDRHQMGEVVTRNFTAESQAPETRYADMAPKHWEEFPNGGPPQYQRAPTEYERPPPYYYPGSGEQ